MKRKSRQTFLVGAVVVGALMLPSIAAAQGVMDGTWLRLRVSAAGLAIDNADTGSRRRGRFVATCYAQLTWDTDAQGEFYTARIVCEEEPPSPVAAKKKKGPKSWTQMADTLRANVLADGAALAIDGFLTFQNASESIVGGYGTHIIEPRINAKKGILLRTTWTTLGAEANFGSSDGFASSFYGAYRASGSTIKPEKLPDGVEAALVPLP